MFKVLSGILMVLTIAACSSDSDDDSSPGVNGDDMVNYRVSFNDRWTAGNFPTLYPSNAHFSGLIGAVHNEQVRFWEQGQPASPGVRTMAETGGKSPLSTEVEQQISEGKALALLSGGGISSTPGSVSLEFSENSDYPQVTLVSMIAPSPDWFIGVANLSLLDANGEFVERYVHELLVYDAGTDKGTRFTSSDSASPGEVISLLSCQLEDCDFLDGLHRDEQATTRYIGEFVFERLP